MKRNNNTKRSSRYGFDEESENLNPTRRDAAAAPFIGEFFNSKQPPRSASSLRSDPAKNPFRPRMGGQKNNNKRAKGKGTQVVVRKVMRNGGPRNAKKLTLSDLVGIGPFSASVGGNTGFQAAVAYGKQSKMLSPTFLDRKANTIRVKHRELIEPALVGSTGFALQESYAINPGLAASFPWLSTTASNWQEYVFHSLSYTYLTRVSTATAGSIMMSPDLDPTNPPPGSEVSASNNPSTVEGPVWHDLRCDVDLKGAHALNRRFVRTGPEVGDLHTFDTLNMYIMTSDCANTNPIGKVWVEYDVSFFLPVVTPSDPISRGCSFFTNSGNLPLPSSTDYPLPADTVKCNPFNVTQAFGEFTPPRGMYILNVGMSTYSATGSNITLHIFKNGTSHGMVEYRNGSAGAHQQLAIMDCISCSGTDTVSVRVNPGASADTQVDAATLYVVFTLC